MYKGCKVCGLGSVGLGWFRFRSSSLGAFTGCTKSLRIEHLLFNGAADGSGETFGKSGRDFSKVATNVHHFTPIKFFFTQNMHRQGLPHVYIVCGNTLGIQGLFMSIVYE